MLPHERSLVKKLENEPFVLLGVNSDNSAEQLKKVQQDEQITWRSFFDGPGTQGPIATKFNVTGWPTIYVLDADHVIRYKDLRGEELEAAIDRLVAEAKAKDKSKAK
jgi:hypothetical protein